MVVLPLLQWQHWTVGEYGPLVGTQQMGLRTALHTCQTMGSLKERHVADNMNFECLAFHPDATWPAWCLMPDAKWQKYFKPKDKVLLEVNFLTVTVWACVQVQLPLIWKWDVREYRYTSAEPEIGYGHLKNMPINGTFPFLYELTILPGLRAQGTGQLI